MQGRFLVPQELRMGELERMVGDLRIPAKAGGRGVLGDSHVGSERFFRQQRPKPHQGMTREKRGATASWPG